MEGGEEGERQTIVLQRRTRVRVAHPPASVLGERKKTLHVGWGEGESPRVRGRPLAGKNYRKGKQEHVAFAAVPGGRKEKRIASASVRREEEKKGGVYAVRESAITFRGLGALTKKGGKKMRAKEGRRHCSMYAAVM